MAEKAQEARVQQILEQTGALVRDDHFVYTTGLHGRDYINKDAIYPNPLLTFELAQMIAANNQNRDISVVVAPEKGGIILSNNVALALSLLRREHVVYGVYAEKVDSQQGGGFYFGRGFKKRLNGQQALLVEDTVNTGYSVEAMVAATEDAGGKIAAISTIFNRGRVNTHEIHGIPFSSLLTIPMEAWERSRCPMCLEGLPISQVLGKGAQFQGEINVS